VKGCRSAGHIAVKTYPHIYDASARGAASGTVLVHSADLPDIETAPPPEFDGPSQASGDPVIKRPHPPPDEDRGTDDKQVREYGGRAHLKYLLQAQIEPVECDSRTQAPVGARNGSSRLAQELRSMRPRLTVKGRLWCVAAAGGAIAKMARRWSDWHQGLAARFAG